ncbi:hypothetical protein NM688_g6190 [Phlebia brevispora]|uniref:Uncharacterized protein n=1 Tax=Phlebia brevispora TaxID=194682 RepID=A0ACC1SIS1_9APHY|nr:hypothetical protein NM688_g6190 [Phlebia brevispora]
MPRDVQDAIKKHAEDADPTQDPDYQAAVRAYQKRHICRLEPWPEDLMQAYTEHAKDRTVFKAMLGPKTFHVIGNLKDWDITGILPSITQPTLVINGRYDTAGDGVVAPFFENIPKVKWVQFSESSHTPFMEEPERYFQVVGQFLSA